MKKKKPLSKAVAELVQVLRDPDAEARYAATMALGALGPMADEAITPLVELMKNPDEDFEIREVASIALGDIGEAAAPVLEKAMKSNDPDTKELAEDALAYINEAEAEGEEYGYDEEDYKEEDYDSDYSDDDGDEED